MSIREEKKAAVRAQILQVCSTCFRQKGFDETTINDIIDGVGISRQTFFNYFSGKQAVLTELGLDWLKLQSEQPRLGPKSIRDKVVLAGTRNAIRSQLRAIASDKDFMRLVFTRTGLMSPDTPAGGEGYERTRGDYTRSLFEGIAMVMRAAQESGEVRHDVDPMQAAEMYVSLMLMTIRFWLVDYWQDDIDLETRAMQALDILEAGLAPRTIGAG
jgi:AcrR family transcriptional regulator